MSCEPLFASDYVELHPGDKVPSRGLAVKGRLVYKDGTLLGATDGTRDNPAIQWVIEGVEIRYRPIDETPGAAA